MKIPLNNLDTININGDLVTIKLENFYKNIQFQLSNFPFSMDLMDNSIDDEKKVRLIEYFLTSNGSPVKIIIPNLSIADRYKIVWKNVYTDIIIENDPTPDYGFRTGNFGNIASLHWHMIKHCFYDFFVFQNRDETPPIFISNTDDIPVIWQEFITQIQCPHWGFDLNNFENRSSRWQREQNRLSIDERPGCTNCIHDDVDRFINCLNFFETFTKEYIKKIRKWIIETVRDQKNWKFYNNSKPICNDTTLERHHVHINNDGKKFIYAYVMDEKNEKIYVYIMIFQKRNKRKMYRIKSTFGLAYCENKEEAFDLIYQDSENRKRDTLTESVENYCHESNWFRPPNIESIKNLTQKFK